MLNINLLELVYNYCDHMDKLKFAEVFTDIFYILNDKEKIKIQDGLKLSKYLKECQLDLCYKIHGDRFGYQCGNTFTPVKKYISPTTESSLSESSTDYSIDSGPMYSDDHFKGVLYD